jgi:soluble lytic murein transglycosylase-like protein
MAVTRSVVAILAILRSYVPITFLMSVSFSSNMTLFEFTVWPSSLNALTYLSTTFSSPAYRIFMIFSSTDLSASFTNLSETLTFNNFSQS